MAPPLRTMSVRDFSGGLNLRDAPPELGRNECADAWNVTFDERGSVVCRLGYTQVLGDDLPDTVKSTYYSPMLDLVIVQCGDGLYTTPYTTGDPAVLTFSAERRVKFADFNGKVYCAHPEDGLYHSNDGATWTSLVDADLPDNIRDIAVWQNKLWAAVGNAVYWSAAGDGTSWGAADFNALREKDDEPIIALHGASGLDIVGRQGLLAFKRRSAYRIYDSTTGAYQTIDAAVGTASNVSVVSCAGRTWSLAPTGIYSTNGTEPMKLESGKIERLFNDDELNRDDGTDEQGVDQWAVGAIKNRLYFSLARAGFNYPTLALEMHANLKWITAGSDAFWSYANSLSDGEVLLATTTFGGDGMIVQKNLGGTDDGASIESRFQTRWFEPQDGFETQAWRMRMFGRGAGVVKVLLDYADEATGTQFTIEGDGSSDYDDGVMYDTGATYAQPVVIDNFDVYTPGRARAYSVKITATTDTTEEVAGLLGSGVTASAGAWAFYGFDLAYVPFTPA